MSEFDEIEKGVYQALVAARSALEKHESGAVRMRDYEEQFFREITSHAERYLAQMNSISDNERAKEH